MTFQATASGELHTVRSASDFPSARTFGRVVAFAARFARAGISELASIVAEDLSHGQISRDPRDWER